MLAKILTLNFFNTVLLVLLIATVLYCHVQNSVHKIEPFSNYSYSDNNKAAACSAASCGASDPVSDPAYNMREIAKQCILLEEHLVEKNKYCRDCIIKHFLHNIALAEESQMLAGNRIKEYPLMADAAYFFRKNMDDWLASADANANANGSTKVYSENANVNVNTSLDIASVLRDFRKQIIAIYYPLKSE